MLWKRDWRLFLKICLLSRKVSASHQRRSCGLKLPYVMCRPCLQEVPKTSSESQRPLGLRAR
ncbi:hypothetical protein BD626DRAFT_494756 [Schizophyllum amplum]|uniref:Uncharacterized protein n=1 Tax=Schizophyllum amplum TaxID=97359 RepID=A0A550CFL3_9AGAR|nr:hypothetical protein BD626DRAFT_494756 [Auriculariopsis ampla]